ncbi:MAG: hypothetical protein WD491_03620 [Balneolales bacterium]
MPYVHRRQFFIGPESFQSDGWEVRKLTKSLYLSHCSSLPVKEVTDADGVMWYLLGLTEQTDQKKKSPVEEIKNLSTDKILPAYANWTGRWVLIGNDSLHLDASGLLGCYFSQKGGDLRISSSIKLLSGIVNARKITLKHQDWYPLPDTQYESIHKLLPSQLLYLSTGDTGARIMIPELGRESYSEILDHIQNGLIYALRKASKNFDSVWIPLSAGYDSRLLLAAAVSAKIPVKTFTFRKKNSWSAFINRRNIPTTSYVSKADMTLPPQIADKVNVEHYWITSGKFSQEALSTFDEHTDNQINENDRAYFSFGQYDWLDENDLILRGGVFEVGHCYYYKYFAPDMNFTDMLNSLGLNPDSPPSNSLRKWIKWDKETHNEHIDWRDRFYIEQRLAGWLSSIEQGLDLVKGENFYAINSQNMFKYLLSIPKEKRINLNHHVDLIRKMAPDLLELPFNPPDPLYHRIERRILQFAEMPLGVNIRRIYRKIKRKGYW